MSIVYNALGVIGNLCFGFACASMAINVVKTKHVKQDWMTVILFCTANVSFYTYLFGAFGFHWLTTVLSLVEVGSWFVVLGYKVTDALDVAFPEVHYASAEQMASVKDCTRSIGHPGPCNGWPVEGQCPGFEGWVEHYGHTENFD